MTLAQATGRLGELLVETTLVQKGWLCGNFNNQNTNARCWDVFAKKGAKTRVIRVKTATKSDATWEVPKDLRHPFKELAPDDPSDWTAVVVNAGEKEVGVYLIPTGYLRRYIEESGFPDWEHLHLYFRPAARKVNHPRQYGLDVVFSDYLNNWEL